MTAFPAELTLDNARPGLEQARAHAAGGDVDLAGLRRFDSAAVAVLVALRREAAAAGAALPIRNAPPNLRTLASLYGVEELLFGATA